MPRSLVQILACLTLGLALFPLAVGKPGLPMTFKADEPAYYLMTMSLAFDQDLRCDPQDTRRGFDQYPYLPIHNLIVMTDNDWETVYYGKPYVYSLMAAPFARLFGANGMVALNMLLYCGMIWMGVAYLRKFNPDAVALTFTLGFFLLSSSWAYVFWLHPEIFMMTSIMVSLFLVLYPFETDPTEQSEQRPRAALWHRIRAWFLRPTTRAFLSGAALTVGAYHKPQVGVFALPILVFLLRRMRYRETVNWMVGAVLFGITLCAVSYGMSGHPSAYLGVQRSGTTIRHPGQKPYVNPPPPTMVTDTGAVRPLTESERIEAEETRKTANSWQWMFRIPEFSVSRLVEEGGYFIWGRHTGLFTYMPFTFVALVLFLFHGRSTTRWVLFASLGIMALFNMLWIPHNWHGGGGFVGNRYFVIAYPAFLFLVTKVRPTAMTLFGYAAGALLVGPIFFTPFGAPIPEPTLQAHVRNNPIRKLPFEFALRTQIPGYRGIAQGKTWWEARKDLLKGSGDDLWFHGATTVETWITAAQPLDALLLVVKNLAPGNQITLKSKMETVDLTFAGDEPYRAEARTVTIQLGEPVDVRERDNGSTAYVYRLMVSSTTGQHRPKPAEFARFYVGAELRYLGPPELLDVDLYDIKWGKISTPRTVASGETFGVDVVVVNRSKYPWLNEGPARVKLGYRWLERRDERVVSSGGRGSIGRRIAINRAVRTTLSVKAPEQPGDYLLEVDLILEHVSWFADRNDDGTVRRRIRVEAATPPEPAVEN